MHTVSSCWILSIHYSTLYQYITAPCINTLQHPVSIQYSALYQYITAPCINKLQRPVSIHYTILYQYITPPCINTIHHPVSIHYTTLYQYITPLCTRCVLSERFRTNFNAMVMESLLKSCKLMLSFVTETIPFCLLIKCT